MLIKVPIATIPLAQISKQWVIGRYQQWSIQILSSGDNAHSCHIRCGWEVKEIYVNAIHEDLFFLHGQA